MTTLFAVFASATATTTDAQASTRPYASRPYASHDGWRSAGFSPVRGITIGPIENAYHPSVGYGSDAFARALRETRAMGGTWISITPFGRVHDLSGMGVDPVFEADWASNREAIARSIHMAHAQGLRVLLVPHLWVESGEWRALIDPKTSAGWQRWAKSYEAFVLSWANVAERAAADMFSVGVELRSWVTTTRAPSFVDIVRKIRHVYSGTLTYSGNWDDIDQTVVLGEIDVIGINAFYPLAEREGASFSLLLEGGERVRSKVRALSEAWNKPVMFTEMGYTTRPDPAVKPWEWPDQMRDVKVDQAAQAVAYKALLAPLLDEPDFVGFFVWRVYADPDDVSQEGEWGFSPRGKLAELVLRDAFHTRWAAEPTRRFGFTTRALVPGVWP